MDWQACTGMFLMGAHRLSGMCSCFIGLGLAGFFWVMRGVGVVWGQTPDTLTPQLWVDTVSAATVWMDVCPAPAQRDTWYFVGLRREVSQTIPGVSTDYPVWMGQEGALTAWQGQDLQTTYMLDRCAVVGNRLTLYSLRDAEWLPGDSPMTQLRVNWRRVIANNQLDTGTLILGPSIIQPPVKKTMLADVVWNGQTGVWTVLKENPSQKGSIVELFAWQGESYQAIRLLVRISSLAARFAWLGDHLGAVGRISGDRWLGAVASRHKGGDVIPIEVAGGHLRRYVLPVNISTDARLVIWAEGRFMQMQLNGFRPDSLMGAGFVYHPSGEVWLGTVSGDGRGGWWLALAWNVYGGGSGDSLIFHIFEPTATSDTLKFSKEVKFTLPGRRGWAVCHLRDQKIQMIWADTGLAIPGTIEYSEGILRVAGVYRTVHIGGREWATATGFATFFWEGSPIDSSIHAVWTIEMENYYRRQGETDWKKDSLFVIPLQVFVRRRKVVLTGTGAVKLKSRTIPLDTSIQDSSVVRVCTYGDSCARVWGVVLADSSRDSLMHFPRGWTFLLPCSGGVVAQRVAKLLPDTLTVCSGDSVYLSLSMFSTWSIPVWVDGKRVQEGVWLSAPGSHTVTMRLGACAFVEKTVWLQNLGGALPYTLACETLRVMDCTPPFILWEGDVPIDTSWNGEFLLPGPGQYVVTAMDSLGCAYTSGTVDVEVVGRQAGRWRVVWRQGWIEVYGPVQEIDRVEVYSVDGQPVVRKRVVPDECRMSGMGSVCRQMQGVEGSFRLWVGVGQPYRLVFVRLVGVQGYTWTVPVVLHQP